MGWPTVRQKRPILSCWVSDYIIFLVCRAENFNIRYLHIIDFSEGTEFLCTKKLFISRHKQKSQIKIFAIFNRIEYIGVGTYVAFYKSLNYVGTLLYLNLKISFST